MFVGFVLDMLVLVETLEGTSANVDAELLSNESRSIPKWKPRPRLEELRGDESTLDFERDHLELALALIKSTINKTAGLIEAGDVTPHCR